MLDDAELIFAPDVNVFHSDMMPQHEIFMLSCPTQSYITCTIIGFTYNCIPRKLHNYVVMAVDSASSLQLDVKELLYNLREKEIGYVLGFARVQ